MGRRKKSPRSATRSSTTTPPASSTESITEPTEPSVPTATNQSDDTLGTESNSPPWQQLTSTVDSNREKLDQLVELVAQLADRSAEPNTVDSAAHDASSDAMRTEVARMREERDDAWQQGEQRQRQLDDLTDQYETLSQRCEELVQQNEDLAATVAQSQVRSHISDQQTETLSWDQRKAMIYRQMEDNTFDADEFVDAMASEQIDASDLEHASQDPIAFLQELLRKIDQLEDERDRNREEISQLQRSLEERPPITAGGDGQTMAVGAAALVGLLDDNELVQQERQRLQELQTQWETKFRQMEVESSLERAKLSRERQELANKLEEVENDLIQAKKANRTEEETGGASRKWLAKLGIE